MNTLESHFVNSSDIVRAIYDKIVATSSEMGPVEQDPKKTSIHLNRKYAFAGIKTRRECLVLTLKSVSEIDSERIFKREQASANRWYNDLKIDSPDQIDRELCDWLRASYESS